MHVKETSRVLLSYLRYHKDVINQIFFFYAASAREEDYCFQFICCWRLAKVFYSASINLSFKTTTGACLLAIVMILMMPEPAELRLLSSAANANTVQKAMLHFLFVLLFHDIELSIFNSLGSRRSWLTGDESASR